MTRDEYIEHHRRLCDDARSLSIAKNHDYTGNADNPFANFERVEALGICGTATGFLVRITDKVSRLATFARHGRLEVASESVRDTVVDAINYLALLSAWIESRKEIEPPRCEVRWMSGCSDQGDEA
jgi:hypothetical protein